jgi:7,8-dihydropterin-6-yl-methyl-4-(beta-D-ribofuranosyl)aminobenzene 5'-phosphate synthase
MMMLIKTLVENTSISEDLDTEHGLSFYIEVGGVKLLFDTGGSDKFIKNSKKIGVDLQAVDLVIISHGHNDHGGGLKAFMDVNKKAKIYVNKKAFGDYYASKPNGKISYIGFDKGLLDSDRFIFVDDYLEINENLQLFSKVSGRSLLPSTNKNLLMKVKDEFLADDFSHEQNLIIKEDGKTLLIAGCAHRGIVNIVDSCIDIIKSPAKYVIGGFHLYSSSEDRYEDGETIKRIGAHLLDTGSKYYTCHCTGIKSYERLKSFMGDKIDYITTGDKLII